MKSLRRLWQGEIDLPDAFWTWAVLGGLLVNLASSAACLMLLTFDRPVLALAVGYGLSLPYNGLAVVGVWRSAARYDGDPRKAELMRVVTVVGMLLLSVT